MGTFRLYAGSDGQAHIETIELKAKKIYIDGKPLDEPAPQRLEPNVVSGAQDDCAGWGIVRF